MTKRAAITLVIGLSLAVFCSYCALEAKEFPSSVPNDHAIAPLKKARNPQRSARGS